MFLKTKYLYYKTKSSTQRFLFTDSKFIHSISSLNYQLLKK